MSAVTTSTETVSPSTMGRNVSVSSLFPTPCCAGGVGRQVLCVTHLPQIAAMADAEFTVEKRVEHERTYTSVLHLDDSGRRQELARLIGGSMITETTLAGAAELLRLADEAKKGDIT